MRTTMSVGASATSAMPEGGPDAIPFRYTSGSWDRTIQSQAGRATYGFIRPERLYGQTQASDVFAHLDRGRFGVRYHGVYYPLGNQLFDGREWQRIALPSRSTEVIFRVMSEDSRLSGHEGGPPAQFWFIRDQVQILDSETVETEAAMLLRAQVQFGVQQMSGQIWTRPVEFWRGALSDIPQLSERMELHFRRSRGAHEQPKVRVSFERLKSKGLWFPVEDPRVRPGFSFTQGHSSLR